MIYLKKLINVFMKRLGLEIKKKQDFLWNCWPIQKTVPVVLFEEDYAFHKSYNKAQKATQMDQSDNPLRRQRHYTLIQLFRNIDLSTGDVVECGTFKGLSAYQLSKIIQESTIPVTFHIFDSFEGLSEVKKVDKSIKVEYVDEELRNTFSYSEKLVNENLKEFDFIKFYKGWIPESFHHVKNKMFSFVHVDVDLYQPIKASIEFFYPRLIKGGIMVFDDYGYTTQFPGAKKAVDEALINLTVQLFISLPSGQAYLIK